MNMMGNNMQLLLALIILSIAPHHSRASFCVCKSGLQSASYQQAIDYACGHGADCSAIGPNGQCYNPNSIQGHCSFATNSYYQKNAPKGATCDFQGAAVITNSDPSGGGCSFSAGSGTSGSTSTGTTSPITTVPTTSPTTPTTTPISGGGGTMPITPVSGTGTPTSGTATGTPTSGTGSPYPTTPNKSNQTNTGVLGGGMGSGLAPTGSSMDENHGIKLENVTLWSVLVVLVISSFTCM